MTKVHSDISMSLDGFITGPDEGVEKPLVSRERGSFTWFCSA